MLRTDLIRRFVFRLALTYLLLILPWPGVERAFSWLYRGTANVALRIVGAGEYVYVGVPAVFHPRGDVEIQLRNPHSDRKVRIEYSSRDWAYLSLAAAIALIVAVPPPWPLRWRAGILMVILFLLFAGLRIAVGAFYGLASVQAISIGEGTRRAAGLVMMGFSATPVNSFVIPILLWVLVLYWNYDWTLLHSTETKKTPMQPPSK